MGITQTTEQKNQLLSDLYDQLDIILEKYVANNEFNLKFNTTYNYELKNAEDLFKCLKENYSKASGNYQFCISGFNYAKQFTLKYSYNCYVTVHDSRRRIDLDNVKIKYSLFNTQFKKNVYNCILYEHMIEPVLDGLNETFIHLILLVMNIMHIENDLNSAFYTFNSSHYSLDKIFSLYQNVNIPNKLIYAFKQSVYNFNFAHCEEELQDKIKKCKEDIWLNEYQIDSTEKYIEKNNLSTRNILQNINATRLDNQTKCQLITQHEDNLKSNKMMEDKILEMKNKITTAKKDIVNYEKLLKRLQSHKSIQNVFEFTYGKIMESLTGQG